MSDHKIISESVQVIALSDSYFSLFPSRCCYKPSLRKLKLMMNRTGGLLALPREGDGDRQPQDLSKFPFNADMLLLAVMIYGVCRPRAVSGVLDLEWLSAHIRCSRFAASKIEECCC